ncbi:MAG: Mfa1 fimbrilin C-terminal domain-containing protein [Bacteroidales bacterium]|nr:Mfa1 fimbrilin C-terminal domain-containing protein [Bacteroidales bacterium]
MKKYLFLAVAALGFAACAEKGIDSPVQNGEVEQSFVAITLAADGMTTRAADGVYDEGRDEERAVKSAYVFFFKDGAAFPVAFDGTTSTNTGASNYLEVELKGDKEAMENVSDVKDAILILQNYKGEYPNQIVAVLNWDPTAKSSYSLADLKDHISDLGDDTDGYIMSNAVYADHAGQTIDAVDLTISNIAKSAEDALKNPVTIYVERVAAKVVFSAANNGKFAIEKEVEGKEIYAQIKGFELYNDYQESWLIKRIDPTWTGLGFSWNEADWHRSYWAQSLETAFENNTFAWTTDNTAIDGYVYCGENTRPWTESNDVRTKVVVKAQLVDADDKPVEIVNWFGKDYIGEEDLLTVIANTLSNTYFTSADGAAFTGLKPEDIKCVDRLVTDAEAYEVYIQLSDAGAAKTWYKYVDGKYDAITVDTLNGALADVQPALVYKNGMTYYWTDIKHLGAADKTAEYGVVRNHVYKVNITDITGYGTPVYDGTSDFITLEKPDDVLSYVSAQINILFWRVVANDYELN